MSRPPSILHNIPYRSPALEGGETGRMTRGDLRGLLCPGGDTKVNKSPKSLLPKAAVTVGRQTRNKYIHKSL